MNKVIKWIYLPANEGKSEAWKGVTSSNDGLFAFINNYVDGWTVVYPNITPNKYLTIEEAKEAVQAFYDNL